MTQAITVTNEYPTLNQLFRSQRERAYGLRAHLLKRAVDEQTNLFNLHADLLRRQQLRPRDIFFECVTWLTPHGTEHTMWNVWLKSWGFQTDEDGNYYRDVLNPDGTLPHTCFAAHIDTVGGGGGLVNGTYVPGKPQHVNLRFEGKHVVKTDGTTNLGADDRAGMTCLLWMLLHNVPGLYYLFIGEEAGCVGSGALALRMSQYEKVRDTMMTKPALDAAEVLTTPSVMRMQHVKAVVSFDRRGYKDIITHQSWAKCASDEYAKALGDAINASPLVGQGYFNYAPSDEGIYTDSNEFPDLIQECTNVSVGYMHEHTAREMQDLKFLDRLCRTLTGIDWESLPITRDVADRENLWLTSYGYGTGGGYGSYGRVIGKSTSSTASWLNKDTRMVDGKETRFFTPILADIVERLAHNEYVPGWLFEELTRSSPLRSAELLQAALTADPGAFMEAVLEVGGTYLVELLEKQRDARNGHVPDEEVEDETEQDLMGY
jgi:hypothetical protein